MVCMGAHDIDVPNLAGKLAPIPFEATRCSSTPPPGHTVHVIFGEPIDPGEFASVPELLDEVQLRISTLEVPTR
jgi:hypothetical protein